ncbi:hypothetical protein HG531_010005 [Fusarium graminearum]|nr:hypothetical protein HG531_010005 [Fusarium graminearum]
MFTIPVEPEIVDSVENDGSPEKLLGLAGKDAKIKEQQRRLEERDLSKVEHLEEPEIKAEFGDRVKLEGPDIATLSMSGCAVDIHRGRRHSDKKCETNEKVVETIVGVAEEVFCAETKEN